MMVFLPLLSRVHNLARPSIYPEHRLATRQVTSTSDRVLLASTSLSVLEDLGIVQIYCPPPIPVLIPVASMV